MPMETANVATHDSKKECVVFRMNAYVGPQNGVSNVWHDTQVLQQYTHERVSLHGAMVALVSDCAS